MWHKMVSKGGGQTRHSSAGTPPPESHNKAERERRRAEETWHNSWIRVGRHRGTQHKLAVPVANGPHEIGLLNGLDGVKDKVGSAPADNPK